MATNDHELTTDEAAELAHRQANDEKRIAAGRFFIDEAASLIGEQQEMNEFQRAKLCAELLRFADLPDDHKHKLIVRDPRTSTPVQHGVRISIACMVFRSDVNAWLEKTGMPYRWEDEVPPQAAQVPPKPVQRQAAHDAAILAKLAELGFDAQAVPPAPAGKPSPAKQAVRAALGYTPDVMNKAWMRLRKDQKIKDA